MTKIDYVGYSKKVKKKVKVSDMPESSRKIYASFYRGKTRIQRILDKNYEPLLGNGFGVGIE